MTPLVPLMSDASILAHVEVGQLRLVVDDSVPLFDFIADSEGLTRPVPVGYSRFPDSVHVHPARLTQFHLVMIAATTIFYAANGFRSAVRA